MGKGGRVEAKSMKVGGLAVGGGVVMCTKDKNRARVAVRLGERRAKLALVFFSFSGGREKEKLFHFNETKGKENL